MTPTQAAALLGLSDGPLTADAVRSAFAREVKKAHPDHAAVVDFFTQPSMDQTRQIMQLRLARDVLIAEVKNQNNACALCCGTGKVRGKIGMQGCSACEGTGERK